MPPVMYQLSRRTWWLGGLLVLLLTALFTTANIHWLAANTVTYGLGQADHLIASFVYRDILGELTPRSLLAALAYSDYPPLVHWGVVALYRVFGVSEDVAPLVNMFYLAVLLGATFWIAASLNPGAAEGGMDRTAPSRPARRGPDSPHTLSQRCAGRSPRRSLSHALCHVALSLP